MLSILALQDEKTVSKAVSQLYLSLLSRGERNKNMPPSPHGQKLSFYIYVTAPPPFGNSAMELSMITP
jgi:hypothetical protein